MSTNTQHLLNSTRLAKFNAHDHATPTIPNPFGIKRLARRICIAPSTLSKLRHYTNRWPTLATAVAMADELGVTPEEMFAAVRKDLKHDKYTKECADT